jgi:hypothetical protein
MKDNLLPTNSLFIAAVRQPDGYRPLALTKIPRPIYAIYNYHICRTMKNRNSGTGNELWLVYQLFPTNLHYFTENRDKRRTYLDEIINMCTKAFESEWLLLSFASPRVVGPLFLLIGTIVPHIWHSKWLVPRSRDQIGVIGQSDCSHQYMMGLPDRIRSCPQ